MTEVYISKKFMAFLFILWISPVVSSIWGFPTWLTITLVSFLMVYAGHELIHAWVCKIYNLKITELNFDIRGNTYILFEEAEDSPDKEKAEAHVFLGGIIWDSLWFTISSLSAIFYAFYLRDFTPLTVGLSLILVLILNLAMPGSDWQEYRKRTTMRA